MKNTIYQRLYEKQRGFSKHNGNPFVLNARKGLIVARKVEDGTVEFGWSSLHPDDVYDDQTAFREAFDKMTSTPNKAELPTRVRAKFDKFVAHAKRYFQDGKFNV